MKENIHPKYYPKATVKCACGNTFTVGSTKPEIQIEICSKCHPLFTGEMKYVDTAGRVEKFEAKRAKIKPEDLIKKKQRRLLKKLAEEKEEEKRPKSLKEMLQKKS